MPVHEELAINTSRTVDLGSADEQDATLCVIQGESNAFTGTVVIKTRIKDSDFPWETRSYKQYSLASVAKDESVVSTDLTDMSFLICVDCVGMEVEAVITRTGGTLDLGWVFRRG